MAILVNYYDDPALMTTNATGTLVGPTISPGVWWTDNFGVAGLAFAAPNMDYVVEGTGRWREAYWACTLFTA